MLVERRILWWMAKKRMTLTYLGAIVDKEGGGSKDIMHHLQKAHGTFRD